LCPFDEAVRLAREHVGAGRWTAEPSEPIPTDPTWSGGIEYVAEQTRPVAASPQRLGTVVDGADGWRSFPSVWPGDAWVELSVSSAEADRSVLHQRVRFQPRGLAGSIGWWALTPVRRIVLGLGLTRLARAAEDGASAG
jgi:hypothetical protein